MKNKQIIGRAEEVIFPTMGGKKLHARIDTGAKTSSIWATEIEEIDGRLKVRFASPNHDIFNYEQIFEHYDRVRVASSTGHVQLRYKIKLSIILCGRRIKATFTLADRSSQVYPVLIGRSTLAGKFIVDVQRGHPLRSKEGRRSTELQAEASEESV